jgi:hypothetical protein
MSERKIVGLAVVGNLGPKPLHPNGSLSFARIHGRMSNFLCPRAQSGQIARVWEAKARHYFLDVLKATLTDDGTTSKQNDQ